MHDAVDKALRSIAAAPEHPGLGSLPANVLAQVAGQRSRPTPDGRMALVAGLAAVLMGIAGSGFAARSAPATLSLSPFGSFEALAPSTLLGEDR